MDFCEFTAGLNDNDRRLDKVLRNFISETNLSQIYKYLRKNLIRLNNKKAAPETHVYTGDIIKIASFIISDNNLNMPDENAKSSEKKPEKKKFIPQIVFQNKDILIINKPYDSLVHGSNDSLDKQVVDYYKNTVDIKSLSFVPGPLHRLDRKTTGLLCFSFSLDGARWFTENIKTHIIRKEYVAIVQGKLMREERWEDFVSKNENQKEAFYTVKIRENSSKTSNKKNTDEKLALTTIIPEKYGCYKNHDITLVRLIIETGRTHQIRSQAAYHGFPLLGDTAYGGMRLAENQDFFLHAKKLVFPESNPLSLPHFLTAQLPSPFLDFISKNF